MGREGIGKEIRNSTKQKTYREGGIVHEERRLYILVILRRECRLGEEGKGKGEHERDVKI